MISGKKIIIKLPVKPNRSRLEEQTPFKRIYIMTLHPELEYSVPEQTARIARAAFPKSTLCLRIYDELGTIFRDQDFIDLFPRRGQPAQSPFRLALVTLLQFAEELTDRA